jgi:hypothetical protein
MLHEFLSKRFGVITKVSLCLTLHLVLSAPADAQRPLSLPTESTTVSASSGDAPPALPNQSAETPHIEQAYVGTNQCFTCHRAQADSWSETNHAQAYAHLAEKYRNDAACLNCHVTAFDEASGYVTGTEKDLLMVGCESCHGPGALHIDAAQRFLLATGAEEAKIEQEIRNTVIKTPTDAVCITCHTKQAHGSHPPYDDTLPAPGADRGIRQSNRPSSVAARMTSAAVPTRYIPGYSVKTCGSCHYDHYLRWRTEKHSDLTAVLPGKYVADQNCRTCHVDAGFAGSFTAIQSHSSVIGVACESCHGPALEHVRFNVQFIHGPPLGPRLEQAARDSIRKEKPVTACVQCHLGESHKEHPQFEQN